MISSRNYAPSAHLLPFIRRHYIVEAKLPADFCHEDYLMADNGFVRVILAGEWDWWHQNQWVAGSGALLFGPNAHMLRIRVRGPHARGTWKTIDILACPVTFSPHPQQIEAARRGYDDGFAGSGNEPCLRYGAWRKASRS